MLPEKLCSIRTFAPDSGQDSSKSQVEKCDETKLDSCSDKNVNTIICVNEKLKDSSTQEDKSEHSSTKKRKLECNEDQNNEEKHVSKKEKKSKNGGEEPEPELLPDPNGTDKKKESGKIFAPCQLS